MSYKVKVEQSLLRRGADKALARPGRKKATATKLGIYSTYCPWSSIHFLAHCSNFYKPLKKNSKGCLSNQVSAAAMTSASEEKWRTFNCFSVQGIGDSPTGPDPENRVADQDGGNPGRPVSSGLQVPGEPGHFRDFPATFFLQSVLQLHKQRWVILRVDILALWKIINVEDAVFIPPKIIEARTFPADFFTRNFLGRGKPLCRHTTDCCFVSGS